MCWTYPVCHTVCSKKNGQKFAVANSEETQFFYAPPTAFRPGIWLLSVTFPQLLSSGCGNLAQQRAFRVSRSLEDPRERTSGQWISLNGRVRRIKVPGQSHNGRSTRETHTVTHTAGCSQNYRYHVISLSFKCRSMSKNWGEQWMCARWMSRQRTKIIKNTHLADLNSSTERLSLLSQVDSGEKVKNVKPVRRASSSVKCLCAACGF